MRVIRSVRRGAVEHLGRGLLAPPRGVLAAAVALTLAITAQAVVSASVGGKLVAARAASGFIPRPVVAQPGVRPDRWGAERVALQPAAARLVASYGGDVAGLRGAEEAVLATARNEGTVEAFLRLPTSRLLSGLEHYAPLLASADPKQVALAAAGVQKYSGLIHNNLLHHRNGQLIVISLQDQHLTAYDNANVVVDTAVTTGRPTLSTDVGLMRVLRKDSPWTMHSPWPKGSPLWYPDTPVAMVAWFTSTGEGLHDASWEPASALGPGSENGPFASHGCVHLSLAAESVLFNWVAIGTPVVVIPGDGSAVDDQIAQQSVDSMGNPITGTRGA